MTSRERVRAAINHIEPDRIPMDLGATTVTGMAAGTMSKLRKALGLKEELVKVEAPFQILGKVEEDLRRTVQADVVGIFPKKTFLGFENSGWRPWKLQDGTDVLISKDMKYIYDTNGDILVYPQGNDSVRPSMRLPKGGFYFDTIVRQEEVASSESGIHQGCVRVSDRDLSEESGALLSGRWGQDRCDLYERDGLRHTEKRVYVQGSFPGIL